jgi:hypothetical protein
MIAMFAELQLLDEHEMKNKPFIYPAGNGDREFAADYRCMVMHTRKVFDTPFGT